MQAIGRRGRGGLGPVLDVQQLFGPGHRLLIQADVHQHSGDVSDHVMQKRIGADVDNDQLLLAINLDEMHHAIGAKRLATLGAERGKIVLADQ